MKSGTTPSVDAATEKLEPPLNVDDLLADALKSKPTQCTVTKALNKLEGEVLAKLVAAIPDGDTYSCDGLAKALSKLSGVDVGRGAVERHRRKECRCG